MNNSKNSPELTIMIELTDPGESKFKVERSSFLKRGFYDVDMAHALSSVLIGVYDHMPCLMEDAMALTIEYLEEDGLLDFKGCGKDTFQEAVRLMVEYNNKRREKKAKKLNPRSSECNEH
jgi:hypothetical protein